MAASLDTLRSFAIVRGLVALVAAAPLLSGCYVMGQLGYATHAPFAAAARSQVSWGEIEGVVHAGSGDFRESSDPLAFGLEGAIAGSAPGVFRVGGGPTGMILFQPGWSHGWTPALRLRAPFQVQTGDGTHGLVTPGGEVGAYFLGGSGTRSRSLLGVSLTGGVHVYFDGLPAIPVVGVALSYGFNTSIGPTS